MRSLPLLRRTRRTAAALGLAALSAACSLTPPEGPEPAADAFVLPDVVLVEPTLRRSAGVSVAVAEGRIAAVAARVAGARLEAYAGRFVLPGLLDMHSHLPTQTPLGLTEHFGLLSLLHGVTTLREAGDLDGTAVAAAEAAAAGGAPMPRIRACGPFVGGDPPRWANTLVLDDPARAAAVAARLRDEGRACVKVYDELDAPRVRALVAAAEANGLVAMGHVPFGLSYEEAALPDTQHLMGVAPTDAIAAGDHVVHRIMDWSGVDDARLAAVVRASAGRAHTPTLGLTEQLLGYADYERARRAPAVRLLPRMYRDVVWHPRDGIAIYRGFSADDVAMVRAALPLKLQLVRRLHEAGVALRLGSDTQQPFVVPGASIWQEMRLFVRAGIPVEEVWAHATWRAAKGVGIEGLGRLEAGAPADLLVFRDDPTLGLDALESLEAVVVRGRLYERAALREVVEQRLAWYEQTHVDALSTWVARRRLAEAVKRGR